ncbi:MAG: radical SAM protein [Anaerolineales bacterium]
MTKSQPYPPPRLIFWETTAGCNLSCTHCRRITITDQRTPQDLSTDQSYELIDQITSFARPILILSGGEPLIREDIFDIARYAHEAGLITALATNGTLIDAEVAQRIKASGIRRVSVSFDGADASTHDAFRGSGSYRRAMEGVQRLRDVDVPYQINTTITQHNAHQVEQMLRLAKTNGAVALHFFLLVPVGCGAEIAEDEQISPERYEEVLNWLYRAEKTEDLELKATCAPHYFRIVNQHRAEERKRGEHPQHPPSHHRQKQAGDHPHSSHPGGRHALNAMTKGCLAGTGVCFINHQGKVYPCGYLPLEAGDIRELPLERIWASSPLFIQLRDPDLLEGKCGRCEFKHVCGGCRARAYGATGNFLAEEPFCSYEPETIKRGVPIEEEVSDAK